jgi:hypothetical protein
MAIRPYVMPEILRLPNDKNMYVRHKLLKSHLDSMLTSDLRPLTSVL